MSWRSKLFLLAVGAFVLGEVRYAIDVAFTLPWYLGLLISLPFGVVLWFAADYVERSVTGDAVELEGE